DLVWAVLPHLAYIVGCGLAKFITHRNFLSYLQGKLAALHEANEIRLHRECVRNLATQARFPVYHPIDSSVPHLAQKLYRPLARILHRLRKTRSEVRPGRPLDSVADHTPDSWSQRAA